MARVRPKHDNCDSLDDPERKGDALAARGFEKK